MARGGFRIGAGRKKGQKDKKPRKGSPKLIEQDQKTAEQDKIREMLAYGTKAKARFYQEFLVRMGKGENLSIAEKKLMEKLGAELASEVDGETPEDVGIGEDLEAHEYLRRVWNDPKMDAALRIRAAEIVFKGSGEAMGAKERQNERAKTAGKGKFGAGAPPIRRVK